MNNAAERRKHAFREGANQGSQAKTYVTFCEKFGKRALNPDDDTISAYIEHLVETFTSERSVWNYVHGVRTWHKRQGVDWKGWTRQAVQETLRSLRNSMRIKPFQRPLVTLVVLRR